MRHRIHQRKLNRTSEHRLALQRNLAQSLIEHGQVRTTLPKAKNLRPFVEKLLTLAVRVRKAAARQDSAGSLRARRQIHKLLGERSLIPKEHREDYWGMSDAARNKAMRMPSGRRHRTGEPKGKLAFTAESVTHRLVETVAAKLEERPGGYTRIVRLPDRRVGDNAPLALVQLVGEEEAPSSLTKPLRSARKRRADARYKLAVKLTKGKSVRSAAPTAKEATTEGGTEGHTDTQDT
ncbi:MAG TPA: L17 family ribosomal protein [Phycisphaerae bacterium]|nr:L17 family ribosomal protein [Phycisphaerae bacterium]HNU44478.1 L17 family ribosomal protein [Phycisphaerae bacterium]